MNSFDMFRQGFVPGGLRPPPLPQQYFQQPARSVPPPQSRDSDQDAPSRVAHTLTACCRCRQRKTRCDPTLPRCLPCERSGSVCEYYDSTKGRKISRSYVVKLQEKVRQLETELSQFTEDDLPQDTEDMIRPGGFVRLSDSDTPRYLGPSSGIAMTRLLMEEAKRYTESQRISELIPELNARRIERLTRMQSIAGLSGRAGSTVSASSARKKSYPMISAHPAAGLPSRTVADKLIEVFNTRAQMFTPTLHEPTFAKNLDEVFEGSMDPYKTFVVRMVMAISLQKLDPQYAGLADSYYLAAMEHFEDVVRPKDLRTLQCLALISQYSLLTPTRTNVYHIVGLGIRICQQLAIADEKTITSGFQVDPLTLDMRRRLSWIIATMELGLAHSMGRPNGLSKGDDLIDVAFFADVDDEYITDSGIKPGPPSEKKRVAIHFCKMRVCQAEIRRVLYEKKRPEPRNEDDPWFAHMEKKMQGWLDAAPQQPSWCTPWFTGRYHSMIVSMYRPSPQVPKPSAAAALRCYDSSAYVTKLGSEQVNGGAIDITWVFLLTIYMSLDTILWSVSYPEVRKEHPREEIEELVNTSLDIIDQCSARWPGASAASQLYSIFAKACLQSYDAVEDKPPRPVFSTTQYGVPDSHYHTSPSQADPNSPSASDASSMPTTASANDGSQPPLPPQQLKQEAPVFNSPFGFGFGSSEPAPPSTSAMPPPTQGPFADYDQGPGPNQPQFRSGSIFLNPASAEPMGRRFSYFPPDAPPTMNHGDGSVQEDDTPPATGVSAQPTSLLAMSPSLITSPDTYMSPSASNTFNTMSPSTTMTAVSSPTPTPSVKHVSPMPSGLGLGQAISLPPPIKFESPAATPHMQQAQPTLQHTPAQPMPQAYSLMQQPSQPQPQPPNRMPRQTMQQQQRQQQPPPRQQRPLAPPQQPLPAPFDRSQMSRPPTSTPLVTPGTSSGEWFSQPAQPFVAPYAFNGLGGAGGSYLSDPTAAFSGYGLGSFGGVNHPLSPLQGMLGGGPGGFGIPGPGGAGYGNLAPGSIGQQAGASRLPLSDAFGFAAGGPLNTQRQGSLSQEQQLELMDMLETEGMDDIGTLLNMGMGLGGVADGAGGGGSESGSGWH